MEPTDIQKAIINYDGNAVVLASPGSGKTYVLSELIKRVVKKQEIRPYQGVIAISYTRKASTNLKSRAISGGIPQKKSFFGTIDNFCVTQIIESFGNYVFGHPAKKVEIIGLNDLTKEEQDIFKWIKDEHPDYANIKPEQHKSLALLFLRGYVLVDSLELLALHIIKNCKACRNYIYARFKYVFIDEFQDADTYTNDILLNLLELGMVCVAVGDVNQSIFGFAHKDSKYICELAKNPTFKSFTLNQNFRSAVPIINYSNRLLNSSYKVLETDKKSIFLIRVEGDERNIAEFIDKRISNICTKWNVSENSKIAILVKNNKTQAIINENLSTPHRLVKATILDEDLNPKSRLYTSLLRFYFDPTMSFLNIIDDFVDYGTLSNNDKSLLQKYHQELRNIRNDKNETLPDIFKRIANIIMPKMDDGSSISKLKTVLLNDQDLDSYRPMNSNEVQLMTLHKSKGLEFDIVFHLNVCEWELPTKIIKNNNSAYVNWKQDLGLHYVGITRARKACFLVRGTKRTNSAGIQIQANDSEYLSINSLYTLRDEFDYNNGIIYTQTNK